MPVGFIKSNSVNGLLGQIGFFDLNRIKFERDHNCSLTKHVISNRVFSDSCPEILWNWVDCHEEKLIDFYENLAKVELM